MCPMGRRPLSYANWGPRSSWRHAQHDLTVFTAGGPSCAERSGCPSTIAIHLTFSSCATIQGRRGFSMHGAHVTLPLRVEHGHDDGHAANAHARFVVSSSMTPSASYE